MELIYLWVKKYKNIKEQGFNFSPRFECSYDEATQELTINEKKDYVNIFPENINITAIVGENGSGKTSLLKFIVQIINNRHFNVNSFFAIYYEIINNSVVFYKQEQNININNNYQSFDSNKIESNWINYNYKYKGIDEIIRKHSRFNNRILDYTFKHVHILSKYKKILLKIEDKYNFDTFQVVIREKDISFINTDFQGKPYFSEEVKETIKAFINKYRPDNNKLQFRKTPIKKDKIIEYNAFLFFIHFIMLNKDTFNFNDKYIINTLKDINNYENIFEFLDKSENSLCNEESFQDFCKLFNEFYSNIKYLRAIQDNFIQNNKNNEFIINYNLKDDEEKIKKVISNTQYITGLSSEDAFYCDFIDYRFLNMKNNISFLDLSEGEKDIFRLCIDLLHHLDLSKEKNKIFLFDEIDNFMHPVWKRELLNILVKLTNEFIQFTKISCQYNLILTTHSPFILSDLPRENIIFLDKGKQVHPFENKQTFGANIHTLLSHGFFMKDGLMGEFAKERINIAIQYLNQKTLSENEIEYCKNIISIIGEPILRRQLQKMLDSKRLIKIDDINKKIKDMEYELSVLKKHQNKATGDELKDRAKRKCKKKKDAE